VAEETVQERLDGMDVHLRALSEGLFDMETLPGSLTLGDLRSRGTARIGVERNDNAPFHFWRGGRVDGLDADLAGEIGRAMGVRVESVPLEWGNGEPGTITGTWTAGAFEGFDFLATTATNTPERIDRVTFSESYFAGGQTVVVRADSGIGGLSDLRDRKVGVTRAATNESAAKAKLKYSRIVSHERWPDVVRALEAGGVDALVIETPVAWELVKAHRDFRCLDVLLNQEHFGVTLPRDVDGALKRLVDETVRRSREPLFRKWFPDQVRGNR
jgi:ABC-type amino acid transport substrate-binding protein